MSQIKVYQLIDFKSQDTRPEYNIAVPKNSMFIKAMVLHDGIYVWYLIPDVPTMSIVTDESNPPAIAVQTDNFMLVKVGMYVDTSIYQFVDILDVIVEVPDSGGGQNIITYPIFKKK